MANRLVVGAHVLCYINNQPCGQVSNFSWDSVTNHKTIRSIDNQLPVEITSTTMEVNGSINIYTKHGDGGAEGLGITSPTGKYRGFIAGGTMLSLQKYFTILLIDRVTESVLFAADKCKASSQRWDVPTKGLVTGVINFTGVSWNNDSV